MVEDRRGAARNPLPQTVPPDIRREKAVLDDRPAPVDLSEQGDGDLVSFFRILLVPRAPVVDRFAITGLRSALEEGPGPIHFQVIHDKNHPLVDLTFEDAPNGIEDGGALGTSPGGGVRLRVCGEERRRENGGCCHDRHAAAEDGIETSKRSLSQPLRSLAALGAGLEGGQVEEW